MAPKDLTSGPQEGRIANAKLLEKDASAIEELNKFNNICCKQYEKVLDMLKDDSLPRSAIKDYASQSLQYSKQQKRKLDKITSENYLSDNESSNRPIETNDKLNEYMNFIETFKQERSDNGIKMDWKLCWEEGRKKFDWKYKNGESLRSQFSKYKKKRSCVS